MGCHPKTDLAPNNPWLSTIPKESALIIANDKPLDDGQVIRLAKTLQASAALIHQSFEAPIIRQALRWLESIDDVDGLRGAGIDPNGYWAAYLDANQFIVKLPLTDAPLFDSWWSNLNMDVGKDLLITHDATPPGATEDQGSAWATITLAMPHAFWLQSSSMPLGIEPVERWSNQDWSALNLKHRLDGHFTALFSPRLMDLHAETGGQDCRASLRDWTKTQPDWILGTQKLSATHLSMLMRIVPSENPFNVTPKVDVSGARDAGVAGFGLATGITELRAWVLDQLSSIDSVEASCPLSGAMLRPKRWAQAVANRPLPPVVTSIQGIVSRYEGKVPNQQSTQSNQDAPIHYFTEVFLSNPQFMIGLAQMFSADMAAMDFRPGQPPKRIPLALTDPLTDLPVYLSTTDQSIRMSASPIHLEQAVAQDHYHAHSRHAHPWMVASLNFNRLNELSVVLESNAVMQSFSPWFNRLAQMGQSMAAEQMLLSIGSSNEGLDLELTVQSAIDLSSINTGTHSIPSESKAP